ncbi:flavin reductase family protein [Oceanobacillus sp. CAU 1775]
MDDKAFRHAMGKFATGVTVITSKVGSDSYGMTANAFMSVSLNPRLITVSIDNRATMLKRIQESQQFAVNILKCDQQDISRHFAGQTSDKREIHFGSVQGIPVIEESLASVVCDVDNSYVVGDHTLFIGRVKDIVIRDGNPLTFYSGKYGVNSEVS